MAEVGEELEFLLQLGADSSRKEIVTERKGAVKMIEKETQRHFQHEGEVVLFGLSAEKPGAATYILQRWSSKWTEYVDVTSCDDIHDRDKLRVVSKSSVSVLTAS